MTKDIGLKFGEDKGVVLAMKRRNEVECSGIEFKNGEEIGHIGEEGYKSTLAFWRKGIYVRMR